MSDLLTLVCLYVMMMGAFCLLGVGLKGDDETWHSGVTFGLIFGHCFLLVLTVVFFLPVGSFALLIYPHSGIPQMEANPVKYPGDPVAATFVLLVIWYMVYAVILFVVAVLFETLCKEAEPSSKT